MTHYVYSTLTSDNIYATYRAGGNDVPAVEKKILIKGGHGVTTKHLLTPRGVVTSINDEELEHLNANPVFRQHVDGGFLVVEKKKVDPEVVAADMEQSDDSAPRTPEDFESDEKGAKPASLEKLKSKKTA